MFHCFFLHIQDEWSREQLEFFLLRGWEDWLIVLVYCSLAFLFDSLLFSSLSTSSVPSLSFRFLAAWYQVWLIILCRIHSDLVSYGLWSSYLFVFTWELLPALFSSENRWSLFPAFSFLKKKSPILYFSPYLFVEICGADGCNYCLVLCCSSVQWSCPCCEPSVSVSDLFPFRNSAECHLFVLVWGSLLWGDLMECPLCSMCSSPGASMWSAGHVHSLQHPLIPAAVVCWCDLALWTRIAPCAPWQCDLCGSLSSPRCVSEKVLDESCWVDLSL